MARPMKTEGTNQFVNGMEVSGIDPEIVREEQQAAERGNGGKAGSAADLAALQQSAAIHKLQQSTGGGQGYGQPEAQQLFANEPAQGDDPRHYHMHYAPQHQYMRETGGPAPVQGQPGAAQGQPAGNGNPMILNNERQASSANSPGRIGKRRVRLGWTEEETRHLMEGCKRHGVGNWKKILTDPTFEFNCRTAVDLKDRFRTSFPEEYSRLYPNARTHKTKQRSAGGNEMSNLVKINRKERRAFTQEEDERLLQGFLKHGPAWSKIQRDQTLQLGERRSTDLRDRFRNAFPERYTAAGYKGRSASKTGQVAQATDMAVAGTQMPQSINGLEEDMHLQQQSMMHQRYMPVQHPLQMNQMNQMNMGYQPQMYYGQPQINLFQRGQPPQN